MPNPFIRVGVTSKEPQDHRPEPIPPVPEHYEGQNNPYRGIEDHGVPPTSTPNPPGAMQDTKVGVNYLPPERVMHPVPVEIVNRFGREFRRHRVHKMSVNGARTVQFLGRNEARTSVVISNPDAALSLFVGITMDMNPALNGYELKPGKEITLTSDDAVYVFGTAVDPAVQTVQALESYSVQE